MVTSISINKLSVHLVVSDVKSVMDLNTNVTYVMKMSIDTIFQNVGATMDIMKSTNKECVKNVCSNVKLVTNGNFVTNVLKTESMIKKPLNLCKNVHVQLLVTMKLSDKPGAHLVPQDVKPVPITTPVLNVNLTQIDVNSQLVTVVMDFMKKTMSVKNVLHNVKPVLLITIVLNVLVTEKDQKTVVLAQITIMRLVKTVSSKPVVENVTLKPVKNVNVLEIIVVPNVLLVVQKEVQNQIVQLFHKVSTPLKLLISQSVLLNSSVVTAIV
jgi:hypothetical protein